MPPISNRSPRERTRLSPRAAKVGYRRLLVLLRREGWELWIKRCYRLYTEEGLTLRRKRPWRHATAVHPERRRPATGRNDIWSMDFVTDQLADGRRFRALTVLDLFTRECLAIDAGHGLSGACVWPMVSLIPARSDYRSRYARRYTSSGGTPSERSLTGSNQYDGRTLAT